MVNFNLFMLLGLVFVISGCAQNMALTKGQDSVDTSGKSIALLYAKISNQNHPSFQPDLGDALIVEGNGIGTRSDMFKIGDPYKSEDNQYKEYLLSFSLNPGTYHFRWLTSYYIVFPLIASGCDIFLNMKVDVKPNSVVYLGHLDAIYREKKDGESSNCPLFPLIDQAVAGFSTSHLEVAIADKFDEDMKLFITEYPGLKQLTIDKMILPQWTNSNNKYNGDISLASK